MMDPINFCSTMMALVLLNQTEIQLTARKRLMTSIMKQKQMRSLWFLNLINPVLG